MKRFFTILLAVALSFTLLTACTKKPTEDPTPPVDQGTDKNTPEPTIKAEKVEIMIDTDAAIGSIKISYTGDTSKTTDSAADANLAKGETVTLTLDKTTTAEGFTVTVYDKDNKELAKKEFMKTDLTNMEATVMLKVTDKAGGGIEIMENTTDANNGATENGNTDDQNKNQTS